MSSDDEKKHFSSDDDIETDKKKTIVGNKLNDEDIPEYRKITDDNMYEFIIWANERRDKLSLIHI